MTPLSFLSPGMAQDSTMAGPSVRVYPGDHLPWCALHYRGLPIHHQKVCKVAFLYCCPSCPSCPANAIPMGWATWALWAAIKKCSLNVSETCCNCSYPIHLCLSYTLHASILCIFPIVIEKTCKMHVWFSFMHFPNQGNPVFPWIGLKWKKFDYVQGQGNFIA